MAKPLNKPAAPLLPRERIWAAIRALRKAPMSVADIERQVVKPARVGDARRTRISAEVITTYCCRLIRAGIMESVHMTPPRFRLVRDPGVEAPHLNAAGREITKGRWMEQLWRAMRIVRGEWTIQQLAALASTPENPVRKTVASGYVGALVRAGYVAIARPSTRKEPAALRLVPGMWTGPRPPQVLKLAAVYDRNTGLVKSIDDPAEVADEA